MRKFVHSFRLVYKLASEKMSYSFGCIMEGKKNIPKSYTSTTPQSCMFGIPMSAEILAVILCNGLSSDDTEVKVTKIYGKIFKFSV